MTTPAHVIPAANLPYWRDPPETHMNPTPSAKDRELRALRDEVRVLRAEVAHLTASR